MKSHFGHSKYLIVCGMTAWRMKATILHPKAEHDHRETQKEENEELKTGMK